MDLIYKVEGLDKLADRVNLLKVDIRKKGGQFALTKAANVIRDAAIENAKMIDDPATAESISKNIKSFVATKYQRKTGNLKRRIGIMGTAQTPKKGEEPKEGPAGATFYWRFLEFGTRKMRAHPFFLKAMIENRNEAEAVFVKEYGKKLDRLLKK